MLESCRNSFLAGLAVFLAATSSGEAGEHLLAGRWHLSDGAFPSIGIVQYGGTVSILSDAGWSMALLEPETGGILASGEGKWTFEPDKPPIAARFAIGRHSGRLYLRIVAQDTNGPSELKVILQPVEPDVAWRKT